MTQTISLNAVPRPAGGYFFEDYVVGRRFHHVTPRTLTNGDAALYIGLTGARQPVHCCEPLARALRIAIITQRFHASTSPRSWLKARERTYTTPLLPSEFSLVPITVDSQLIVSPA